MRERGKTVANKPKKPDPEKLAEFFAEAERLDEKKITPNPDPGESSLEKVALYVCPQCHRPLESRKEPCPYCHYHGYIPMSEKETTKIRWILFVILLLAAIAVYALMGNN